MALNIEDIRIQSVINQASASILDDPEITGIALGGGHVIVYVERVSQAILQKIPTQINGIPVEVKSSGKLRVLSMMAPSILTTPLSNISQIRPVLGGYSCGCPQITAGTFSGTVRNRSTGERLGLSNNHVLLGAKWGTQEGFVNNPVYQPGAADGGGTEDVIGHTTRGIPVELTPTENLVDAAIFRPTDQSLLSDEVKDLGIPGYAVDPVVGKRGRKSGRTTGLTESTIESIGATIDVAGTGTARFIDQIIFRPALAQGGDSGSIVLDDNGNVFGIVFAGSDEITAVCRSKNLESLLGISFGAVPSIPIASGFSFIPLAVGIAAVWWGGSK